MGFAGPTHLIHGHHLDPIQPAIRPLCRAARCIPRLNHQGVPAFNRICHFICFTSIGRLNSPQRIYTNPERRLRRIRRPLRNQRRNPPIIRTLPLSIPIRLCQRHHRNQRVFLFCERSVVYWEISAAWDSVETLITILL